MNIGQLEANAARTVTYTMAISRACTTITTEDYTAATARGSRLIRVGRGLPMIPPRTDEAGKSGLKRAKPVRSMSDQPGNLASREPPAPYSRTKCSHSVTNTPIPLIDVFAGPGGLNEGFSRLGEDKDTPVFSTVASFEMERSACRTLTLRGTYRSLLRTTGVPESYYKLIRGEIDLAEFRFNPLVENAWSASESEVQQIELGKESRTESDGAIRSALERADATKSDSPWALIGGPPCQAYSLAGRSRRTNDIDFEKDKKHFLYEEYLHILRTFAPPVFVMENVKGLLSSTNAGIGMFSRIKADLEKPRIGLYYDIHSLTVDEDLSGLHPSDFVIRAENFGVPQRRHRVILLGVRRDYFGANVAVGKLTEAAGEVTVREAFLGLPKLRSGISPTRLDDADAWMKIRDEAAIAAAMELGSRTRISTRGSQSMAREASERNPLADWLIDPKLLHIVQHQTRAHMREDLKRYWFAATKALETGASPSLRTFPTALLPNHKNIASEKRPFEDRFRVQVANRAATTVVSHIAKDGHYYIHHDPEQMRSLTVREAARLQTFPDNYFFMGNRTQQYHQVGNAVPPLLANQIAAVVASLFGVTNEPSSK